MMVCNAVNTGCGVVGFFKNACTQEKGSYFLQASSCSMMVRRGGSQKWSCKMNVAYKCMSVEMFVHPYRSANPYLSWVAGGVTPFLSSPLLDHAVNKNSRLDHGIILDHEVVLPTQHWL
jgi:hypothetical protein